MNDATVDLSGYRGQQQSTIGRDPSGFAKKVPYRLRPYTPKNMELQRHFFFGVVASHKAARQLFSIMRVLGQHLAI